MEFLKPRRTAFFIFLLFGVLDGLSTLLLVRWLGIDVEANPMMRLGFSWMRYGYFLIHFAGVVMLALILSTQSWNESYRLKVKTAIFYVYIFVLINNWYQVVVTGWGVL